MSKNTLHVTVFKGSSLSISHAKRFCINIQINTTAFFICPSLGLLVIQCDSCQVDVSTDVTHGRTTRVCMRVLTRLCLLLEPDTQKHLAHLPHTWLSNQRVSVQNKRSLTDFLCENTPDTQRMDVVISEVN